MRCYFSSEIPCRHFSLLRSYPMVRRRELFYHFPVIDMTNPHLILRPGTQVVALVEVRGTDGRPVHPRGAVGVVIQSPADYWHNYRVRFPDHFEASFHRRDLAILAEYKSGGVIGSGADPLADPLG